MLVVGMAVLSVLVLTGCQKVEVGYAGVKIYTLGSDRGETEIVKTGWVWLWPNEELVSYPTFIKQYPFTRGSIEGSAIDEAFYFQSKDGVQCDVDIAVEAYADPLRADVIYKTYRKDLEEVIKINLRQRLRDLFVNSASSLSVDELYSDKKVVLIRDIETALITEMAETGIIIKSVSFLSNIRFPEVITQAIEAKYAAVQEAQRRQNEVEKAKADADIKIQAAKGEAESNRLRQQSITKEMIEWQKVLNEAEAIKKWDGKLPATMMGNSVPFVNVNP
jgi:regulator of protease activity HflC (stomatin/prohibitin superfamily)